MSFLNNLGGLGGMVGDAIKKVTKDPNSSGSQLGDKAFNTLVDILNDKKIPAEPTIHSQSEATQHHGGLNLDDLAQIAGVIAAKHAEGGAKGALGDLVNMGGKLLTTGGQAKGAIGGFINNIGGQIWNKGDKDKQPGAEEPVVPAESVPPAPPVAPPQPPTAITDPNAILAMVLGGQAGEFGKNAVFTLLLQLMKAENPDVQSSWLQVLSQKAAEAQNSGLADAALKHFGVDRQDPVNNSLIESLLAKRQETLAQGSTPHEAQQVAKVIDKLKSQPNAPQLEDEIKLVLVGDAKAALNQDEVIPLHTVKY